MEKLRTLNRTLLLCNRNRNNGITHLFERTVYLPESHTVVHVTWGARHRLWGLLPPRALERTTQRLEVPETILTKPELLRWLRQKKPRWL